MEVLTRKIEDQIVELVNLAAKEKMDKGATLSLWDEWMGKRIKGLVIPTNKQCGGRKSKKDNRENMRWTPHKRDG